MLSTAAKVLREPGIIRFMNNPVQYERVFNEKVPLSVWVNIAKVLKKTDSVTPNYKGNIKISQEKYLRSIRPIVSLIVVAKTIGKMGFGVNDLIQMDFQLITDNLISDVTQNAVKIIDDAGFKSIRNLSSRAKSNLVVKKLAEIYDLPDFNAIEKRKDFVYDDYEIDEEFIEVVKNHLSSQPWPTGIHKEIASKLGCSNAKVSRAIEALIKSGLFLKQKNGQLDNSN